MLIAEKVLHGSEVEQVRGLLADAAFVDGGRTSTLVGKRNLQLAPDSPEALTAGDIVLRGLRRHDAFRLAARPRFIQPPLFSKYETGMEYPEHVDEAVIGGRRNDLSLTLFLTELDAYDGGALAIETGQRPAIVPPCCRRCNSVSFVDAALGDEISRGERLAAVLWVQSDVRDPQRREFLRPGMRSSRCRRARLQRTAPSQLRRSHSALDRCLTVAPNGRAPLSFTLAAADRPCSRTCSLQTAIARY